MEGYEECTELPKEKSKEAQDHIEGLKTSLHYSVGKICLDIANEHKVNFTKEFISTLAELAYRQAGVFAFDLESFAKHAKRTTINSEDVKLLVRKSKTLHEHICSMDASSTSSSKDRKKKKKQTVLLDEASNDVQILENDVFPDVLEVKPKKRKILPDNESNIF